MTLQAFVLFIGTILIAMHGLGCMFDGNEPSPRRCTDISRIDLRNATIPLEDAGLFKLVDGKGCTSDAVPGKCDWKQTLTMDRMLYPDKANALRLIKVNSTHVTGSGAWDYVLVLKCLGGQMMTVFQRQYPYGAKLEFAENGVLKIESGHWLRDDAECCPSKKRIESLNWNGERSSFELSDTDLIANTQQHP